MLTLYIQTCCSRKDGDELAWVHPFMAEIFALYCKSDSQARPVVLANVPNLDEWRSTHGNWNPRVEADVRPFSSEKALLEAFWTRLKSGPAETLVSFNGRKHLVPFLYLRSAGARLEIDNPDFLRERYRLGPHIDLADALTFHGLCEKAALLQVAQAWGLPVPKLKEGTDLQALLRNAFETGEPGIWSILMNNGLEYLETTEQVHQIWRKFLKPTF